MPETPSLTAKKSTVGSVKRNAYSESDQQQQPSAKLPRITLDDEGRTGYDHLETGNLLKAFKNAFFNFCLSVAGEISVELHPSFCVQSFDKGKEWPIQLFTIETNALFLKSIGLEGNLSASLTPTAVRWFFVLWKRLKSFVLTPVLT